MTTTNIARLQDKARVAAPGALDGSIRMELYDTLKEFFQRTDTWLLELPIFIDPSTNDYQLETGQNVIIQRLMSIERPSNPATLIPGVQPPYAPMCPPQYLAAAESGQGPSSEAQNPLFRSPRSAILLNAGAQCPILRIYHNPMSNETWMATVSLNICDPLDADGFATPPDWILENWMNYLSSGVICRLMLQPGKPYSSLPGAQYHGRKFNEGVGLARTAIRRSFTYGSQRWAFPRGWNSARPRLPSGQSA